MQFETYFYDHVIHYRRVVGYYAYNIYQYDCDDTLSVWKIDLTDPNKNIHYVATSLFDAYAWIQLH